MIDSELSVATRSDVRRSWKSGWSSASRRRPLPAGHSPEGAPCALDMPEPRWEPCPCDAEQDVPRCVPAGFAVGSPGGSTGRSRCVRAVTDAIHVGRSAPTALTCQATGLDLTARAVRSVDLTEVRSIQVTENTLFHPWVRWAPRERRPGSLLRFTTRRRRCPTSTSGSTATAAFRHGAASLDHSPPAATASSRASRQRS